MFGGVLVEVERGRSKCVCVANTRLLGGVFWPLPSVRFARGFVCGFNLNRGSSLFIAAVTWISSV